MKLEELEIPGVLLAHPVQHEDPRGWFMEILREEELRTRFVQSNHSHSQMNVLRGLHYHAKQADAWYVVNGTCRVGLADLRGTPDSLKVLTVEMAADEHLLVYIPPGVAHGFYAVTELDLVYWVTHAYDNSDEFSVLWNDPTLGVPWGTTSPILSARDREAPPLSWDTVKKVLGGSG